MYWTLSNPVCILCGWNWGGAWQSRPHGLFTGLKGPGNWGLGTSHRPSHGRKSNFCLLRKKNYFSWKSSCSNTGYIKKNCPRHPAAEDEIYAYLTDERYIKLIRDWQFTPLSVLFYPHFETIWILWTCRWTSLYYGKEKIQFDHSLIRSKLVWPWILFR